ncbi:MAG: DEAD/DEAH box helicase [Desulfobacteraceae bacterium]|nr:DEAD/DEAH box helicase [Desulfobacteraceae bacterium]
MSSEIKLQPGFGEMNLSQSVLKALNDVGYETPTAIQTLTIPPMLAGKDVIGQAQTGTGKTAAFACPLLSKINLRKKKVQVLVLAPTRELAIQVAEAFKQYASRMKGFHVLPIYGGQGYDGQLRQLKRGVHVIVGTPGRLMDHMRRGTVKLDELSCIVLDEADEMLRMGFIEDVEWILEQTPAQRQIALFSATMPNAIKKIAQKYLKDPQEIIVKLRTTTAETINQRFWIVKGTHKLDALTRILEAETFDGIIVFVRTKTATVELAEKLEARGFATEALNGDIAQKTRERTIDKLKKGKIDILVATDVAARGLDVERISHVINYDIPNNAEAYIHRVGRTGRAGRQGEAILFVSPRERWMIRVIEKATRQKMELMKLPSNQTINDKRIANFKQSITDTLASENLSAFRDLMDQYRQEYDVPALDISAALARMVHGDKPLLLSKQKKERTEKEFTRKDSKDFGDKERFSKHKKIKDKKKDPQEPDRKKPDHKKSDRKKKKKVFVEEGMDRFRIEVGYDHGVGPGDIVGAIANETGLEAIQIGNIDINEKFSTVDLPQGMPNSIFKILKKVRICQHLMKISKMR